MRLRANLRLFLLPVLLLLPAVALADHRSDAERAQRRLDAAEARIRQVCWELDQARASLDAAISRRNSALSDYDAIAQVANLAAAAITDAQGAVEAAARAAQAAAERAAERR
ncbi:MAG TPA: hypothetical protein VER17_05805, partial [Tepidisphaeraceae bacterium]|nr:hypothetical protein [Tepidisphaeraceae bacterium]